MIDIEWSLEPLVAFLLVLSRVAGLMVFTPVLGGVGIAPQIRTGLVLGLTLLLYPAVGTEVEPVAPGTLSLLLAIATELLVGLLLGLLGHLFLAALQFSGQLMGFQIGFAVINVIDPQTQVEAPVLAILQNLMGVLIFLSLNAHHWFIQAIVDSYGILPGRSFSLSPAATGELLEVFGQIFAVGFRLAAPVILTLAIMDIFIGTIGRAAPQIHILIVGMPLKILGGLLLLGFTAPVMVRFAGEHMSQLHGRLYRLLQLLGQ